MCTSERENEREEKSCQERENEWERTSESQTERLRTSERGRASVKEQVEENSD